MAPDRDVDAFDRRASSYDDGYLGRLHHEIADRTIELILGYNASPQRVLDVGCGTGYLLRQVALRCPDAVELAGVDPAWSMINVAQSLAGDDRLWFGSGVGAEHLPFGDGTFDVVVATTSFDHWSDQRAGLIECARVLQPGGRLVLVDQFSLLYLPTRFVLRRQKSRFARSTQRLLRSAGFSTMEWHRIYRPVIKAVVATK